MKSTICAAALAIATSITQTIPVVAQDLSNAQIDIDYVQPRNPAFQPIVDRLRRRHVLEELKIFLAPLNLPAGQRLQVKLDECGALTTTYESGGPAIICYEYIERLERIAPRDVVLIGPAVFNQSRDNPGYLTRDDALVGAFVQVTLVQVAHAMFDIFKFPVWGREEFAADNVAGFLMLQFGKTVAWRTLIGSAWLLAQSGATGIGDFYAAQSPEAQRFFNYVCLAYASDPVTFGFLAKTANLPEERAKYCKQDYETLQYSFDATFMQHVDRDKLKKVRELIEAGKLLKQEPPG